MTYLQICDDNKNLYGKLERLTYALMEIDPVKDAGQYNLLLNEREYCRSLINTNLDRLEVIWLKKPADDTPREAYRRPERGEGAEVKKFYANTHQSLKSIAQQFNISESQVSRYITEYLTHKHA